MADATIRRDAAALSLDDWGGAARRLSRTVKHGAVWVSLALAGAWMLLVTAALTRPPGDASWAIAPVFVVVLGGTVVWRLIRSDRASLLTPLPLAFALGSLFYGFGPLLYLFQVDSVYGTANFRIPLDASGLLRVQVLNLVGLTSLTLGLLAAAIGALRLVPPAMASSGAVPSHSREGDRPRPPGGGLSDRALLRGYLFFAALAFGSRALHRVWGTNPLEFLPGFLQFTDGVGALAVFLGAIIAGRKGGPYWLLPLVPLSVEVIEGFLALRKGKVLTPLLFAFFGLYLGGRTARVLAGGAALCLVTFVLLYPVINSGRQVVWGGDGTTSAEYFAQRLSEGGGGGEDAVDAWMAWTRWNYTPIQFVLMREYDADRPGDTFREIHWMFIPRAIAPSKPVLDYGARVTEIVFGHRRSSTGPTIFGEAYWNGGWPLVVLSGFVAGVVLFSVSLACLWLFGQRPLLAWPVGFLGILTGQVLQNFFTAGLLGTAVPFFLLVAVVSLLPRVDLGIHSGALSSGRAA